MTRAWHAPAEGDESLPRRPGLWDLWSHRSFHSNRRSLIRQFAFDCERYFHPRIFTEHDHAFLTGISEIELMGLAAYLANHPRTLQVKWHVLFHFDLLRGRPPQYESQQDRLQLVRQCFQAALARVPYHRINFYTTTESLTDQYNRLSLIQFRTLTYPHNPNFSVTKAKTPESNSQKPLQWTMAGAVRREKGQRDAIQAIVDDLWDDYLSPGKAQINIQRGKANWLRGGKIDIRQTPSKKELQDSKKRITPIRYFDHPIEDADYEKLIGDTDIGILPYDAQAYYSRRAGIMGEYLACGIPVVVPAGCWLSEQLTEPIQQHIESVRQSAISQKVYRLPDFNVPATNVPMAGGIVSFDGTQHPFRCEFDLQPKVRAIVVRMRWHYPTEAGTYCRIELRQRAGEQLADASQVQVVGSGGSDATSALFSIGAETQRIQIRLCNAFAETGASIKELEVECLAFDDEQTIPRGAVGAVAADPAHFAEAIDEVARHYLHYKDSAVAHAETWRARHEPDLTISELTLAQRHSAKAA